MIRVEPRLWANGVQGCFRVGAVYLPATSAPMGAGVTPPSSSGGMSTTIGVLTVASLAVGTTAGIASMVRK